MTLSIWCVLLLPRVTAALKATQLEDSKFQKEDSPICDYIDVTDKSWLGYCKSEESNWFAFFVKQSALKAKTGLSADEQAVLNDLQTQDQLLCSSYGVCMLRARRAVFDEFSDGEYSALVNTEFNKYWHPSFNFRINGQLRKLGTHKSPNYLKLDPSSFMFKTESLLRKSRETKVIEELASTLRAISVVDPWVFRSEGLGVSWISPDEEQDRCLEGRTLAMRPQVYMLTHLFWSIKNQFRQGLQAGEKVRILFSGCGLGDWALIPAVFFPDVEVVCFNYGEDITADVKQIHKLAKEAPKKVFDRDWVDTVGLEDLTQRLQRFSPDCSTSMHASDNALCSVKKSVATTKLSEIVPHLFGGKKPHAILFGNAVHPDELNGVVSELAPNGAAYLPVCGHLPEPAGSSHLSKSFYCRNGGWFRFNRGYTDDVAEYPDGKFLLTFKQVMRPRATLGEDEEAFDNKKESGKFSKYNVDWWVGEDTFEDSD